MIHPVKRIPSPLGRRAAVVLAVILLALGSQAGAEVAVEANSDGARCWMEVQKCQSTCMDELAACREGLPGEDDGSCDAEFGACAEQCGAAACE